MPRKTKAELTAEKETLMDENMMEMPEATSMEPTAAEGTPEDTSGIQETAIAGLLADYSTASGEDTAEIAATASQEKNPQNDPNMPGADPADSPETTKVGLTQEEPVGSTPSDAEGTKVYEPGERVERTTSQRSFFQTNFRELDRDLSPEQMQEWNNIYASYRSKSILTGTVIGVDDNRFEVRNPQTGAVERKTVRSLVIIGYRIKVLIPESEVWAPGEEHPDYVMRGMVGAKIDYVVMQVDREGECAIASRRLALVKQRRHFAAARRGHETGAQLKCNLLVVGPRRVLVECGGYDIPLSQRDLSWTAIADLRNEYRPGQELPCRLKEYNSREGKLSISVRDATPNPFVGAENRHPIGSRRQAIISGKYAGGVFCRLPDNVTVLCLYSNLLGDDGFFLGDSVLIHITQYDYNRQLIYGRIISKW